MEGKCKGTEEERELQQDRKPQKLCFNLAHLGPFRHNTLARERARLKDREREKNKKDSENMSPIY